VILSSARTWGSGVYSNGGSALGQRLCGREACADWFAAKVGLVQLTDLQPQLHTTGFSRPIALPGL
jgi:hypothetical protein